MYSSQSLILFTLLPLLYGKPIRDISPTNKGNVRCPPGGLWSSYVVPENDINCASIPRYNKTSTLNLLAVNGLDDDECGTLAAGETICVPPPCETFLVKEGDKCSSIADSQGLDILRFWGYNPGLDNPSCSNLKTDTYVCLGKTQGSNFPMRMPP